jgi:hypothetical protein
MPDYSLGKIYKILCNETGEQYFGSTCEPTLARRLANHITHFNRWKKEGLQFMTSFLIFENNNYHIELVELFPCSSKDELTTREKYHIKNNECVNKYIPMRKMKEYREDNKKEISEYYKKYSEEHKNNISKNNKKWREEHKEKIIEKNKKWREEHKETFTCICGTILTICNKLRHERSQRHTNYLATTLTMDADLPTLSS